MFDILQSQNIIAHQITTRFILVRNFVYNRCRMCTYICENVSLSLAHFDSLFDICISICKYCYCHDFEKGQFWTEGQLNVQLGKRQPVVSRLLNFIFAYRCKYCFCHNYRMGHGGFNILSSLINWVFEKTFLLRTKAETSAYRQPIALFNICIYMQILLLPQLSKRPRKRKTEVSSLSHLM